MGLFAVRVSEGSSRLVTQGRHLHQRHVPVRGDADGGEGGRHGGEVLAADALAAVREGFGVPDGVHRLALDELEDAGRHRGECYQ